MKRCSRCQRTLPLDRYGRWAASKDGLAYHCLECDRARTVNTTPTASTSKLLRTRARHRAAQELIKMHPEEFQTLYDGLLADAIDQAARLNEQHGQDLDLPDDTAVRLKPGKRADGEEVRVDTDWCAECRRYHDNGHHAPAAQVRLTTEELIEDVEWMAKTRETPERMATRIGSTVEAVARRLYRAGRPDLANQFQHVVKSGRSWAS